MADVNDIDSRARYTFVQLGKGRMCIGLGTVCGIVGDTRRHDEFGKGLSNENKN